jgi:phosphoserine phosphatase RsbU/P
MPDQVAGTLAVAENLGRWQQRSERLDRITRLAQKVFGVAWTSITVLDDQRAWFPSAQGFDVAVMPREDTFCNHTVRADEGLLIPDALVDPRLRELPAVRDQGIRFYAGVPLRDPSGNAVGVFCLYDTRVRDLDAEEQQTLEDLAAWAEQELLASAEMLRASQVQTSMLPAGPIRLAGWDVHGMCLPALAVGGDLFDYAVSDDVLHVGLGDVMGKGTGAALLGAGVRSALRGTHAAVVAGVDLGVTVTQVARALGPDLHRAESFVTLVEGAIDLDDGYFRYVDAGSGLTLVVRTDGTLDRLDSQDLPLGVLSDDHWTEKATTLEPGDRMILFSDGLLDLVEDQVEWWVPIGAMVAAHEDATDLLTHIADLTARVQPGDDVTVVAVFRRPAA